MPRGGARNRSGPQPSEGSERSERRGFKLTALPAEGYRGPVPAWPLPVAADEDVAAREAELWAWAWRTPQACAWALPSELWRARSVAMWVRMSVRVEAVDAPASLIGQVHRFADQVGLTTAGLAEMGWKVAVDEVAERAAGRPAPAGPVEPRQRRLRAAGDAG